VLHKSVILIGYRQTCKDGPFQHVVPKFWMPTGGYCCHEPVRPVSSAKAIVNELLPAAQQEATAIAQGCVVEND
jgi:hypothetical protein